jgi:fructan beta-fructosidase
LIFLLLCFSCKNKEQKEQPATAAIGRDYYNEPYRPQFHFSPEENWMNDPNGMVYHKGVYHLFYQYYPEDIVWGPMHWGHATSKDLIHWEHKPIALYPDKLGYIFSGSAVLDTKNTSGFGSVENPPLVAIFTYHSKEIQDSGALNYETQGIAYSLDNGDTWTKYQEGNPVIKNDGMKDFRDPKVIWHEASQKWVLTLVAGDHAQFYGSKNLRDWELMGGFGTDKGAHGGVWECPDLFPIKVEGTDEEKWLLFISIGTGAPNGGSGTQYFVGDFDGVTFTTDQTENKWVDMGTDNYAGVTYSNAPNDERIFIGWMSNWRYATKTPTEKWRSAMTIPRRMTLQKVGDDFALFSYPVESLDTIIEGSTKQDVKVAQGSKVTISDKNLNPSEIRFTTSSKDFQLKLGNSMGEEVLLTMMGREKTFFLDRSKSGKIDFQEDFGAGVQQMPVPNMPEGEYEVRILVDRSSIEIFINKGQYVVTAQVFPNSDYTDLTVENLVDGELVLKDFGISKVEKVW